MPHDRRRQSGHAVALDAAAHAAAAEEQWLAAWLGLAVRVGDDLAVAVAAAAPRVVVWRLELDVAAQPWLAAVVVAAAQPSDARAPEGAARGGEAGGGTPWDN